jgi:glycosyltransferase involved in cell wall biosynthesis
MKKKLLYLTSRLPWPPIGGEKNKTFAQLKILSEKYNITLISFGNINKDQKAIDKLKDYAPEIHLIHEVRLLKLLRCLKVIFDYKPIQIHLFYSKKFQNKVDELLPSHDLLFCNLIRTAEYGLNTPVTKPKFLDLSDSIGLHYLNAANKITSPIWKFIYKFEGPRLFAYEKQCVRVFNKSFLFNQLEVTQFDTPKKIICLPHGVNKILFTHNSIGKPNLNRICFLGKMDYRPNIEAALWFVLYVLPILPLNFEFWVIGASPTNQILNLTKLDSRIKITGFVEDPFAIIKASLCSVIPVFTGGGIQNKLIEAMAVGSICITTSFCTNALKNIQAGQHLLIADDAKTMAKTILDLHSNIKQYEPLKEAAKSYIKTHQTWEAYGELLKANLE